LGCGLALGALYFRKQGFSFETHLRSAPFVLCAEPALGTVAEREMTTVAEFFRRELQGIVKARLAHGVNGRPAAFRPSPGQRIAA